MRCLSFGKDTILPPNALIQHVDTAELYERLPGSMRRLDLLKMF